METSTSIAGIYYQIQDEWQAISSQKDWRLALWVVPYENVAIIDKFNEIERSPMGSSDDVFFRFETEYRGDKRLFLKELWEEYRSWFTENLPEEYDLLKAFKADGTMRKEYVLPDIDEPDTFRFLWSEFLRFKSCIQGMDERNFCIYFPPSFPDSPSLTECFRTILKEGVPEGIRLVTIDYSEKRKVKLSANEQIIILKPQFDLKAAVNNEMDKESGTYDSPSFDSRYRKQIRKVMDATLQKNDSTLDKEVRTLLSILTETSEPAVHMATPMIISQAYYIVRQFDKSLHYADETIDLAAEQMAKGEVNGYPIWKVAMFQKAAVLVFQKKWDKGVEIYRQVAEEATRQQDAFYIMESYRMCGYLKYESGMKEDAFECYLLSLAGGSYLEERVRRESTFIYSAYMALILGKDVRTPEEVKAIEEQLEIWLGDKWRNLVFNDQAGKSKIRRKSSFFSLNLKKH